MRNVWPVARMGGGAWGAERLDLTPQAVCVKTCLILCLSYGLGQACGRHPGPRHQAGGGSLLQDAVNRAVSVAQNTGVRALLAHTLHERPKLFYEYYGFQPSPANALVLMLRLSQAKP